MVYILLSSAISKNDSSVCDLLLQLHDSETEYSFVYFDVMVGLTLLSSGTNTSVYNKATLSSSPANNPKTHKLSTI
jgi:hypothetical protein